MRSLTIPALLILLTGAVCARREADEKAAPEPKPPAGHKRGHPEPEPMSDPVEKTDSQWRESLSPEQYHVLRRKGTEPAFSGAYWDHKGEGVYRCAGCGQALYDAEAKFKSGTGWPSFTRPIDESHIDTTTDLSHGMRRTEVMCSRCGGHLGHVFDDGPAPTGQRHCINSAALTFSPKE